VGERPVALVIGTFDPDYPRNRQMQRLLDRLGYELSVEHVSLWGPTRFDVLRRGPFSAIRLAARVARSELRVAVKFLRGPKPTFVMLLYPGQLDMLAIGLLARLRRTPVVLDAFVSLRETMVDDRGLAPAGGALDRLLGVIDRWAMRLAAVVLADTPADASYFAEAAGIDPADIGVVWVGAEPARFPCRPLEEASDGTVLFYGTYIPLHGIETIVRAAAREECGHLRIQILGSGQDRCRVEELAATLAAPVRFLDPVPEDELVDHIAAAEICLGVFGTGEKAARVVPNKVFQCLSVGRPVITAATPATVGALGDAVFTVPPGDDASLARAMVDLHASAERRAALARKGRALMEGPFGEEQLARTLADVLPGAPAGDGST
jgi:glycosyltransferase involved in cell wall biosynthesis